MNLDQCKIKNSETIQKILNNNDAPKITECKKTFWDSEVCVYCRLIRRESDRILLFHAIEKRWNINEMTIEPPMFTIATYWIDRPYNLYCWFKPDGSYVASYFNVVELPGYRFKKGTLIYRDLVLDVLVRPNQSSTVLDMDELSDVDNVIATEAKRVSELLLRSSAQIINECLSTLPAWIKRKQD